MRVLRQLCAAGLLVSAGTLALAAPSPLTGAIFTSNSDATIVDANIYDLKTDVYFTGGPAHPSGSGLGPDGVYYFQVTDPSGATLLSEDDAVCRQVNVSGGYITSTVVVVGCVPHLTGQRFDYATTAGITVQLMPYADTPNNGGEYKLWAINAAHATANGRTLTFDENWSKTDNFKVKIPDCVGDICNPQETVTIGGMKYFDANTNGVNDGVGPPPEAPIAGFRVMITTGGNSYMEVTDALGLWQHAVKTNDPYTVCETLPVTTPPWMQTGPLDGAISPPNATANASRCWVGIADANNLTLDFGNVCIAGGSGRTLGYWSNKNGQKAITDAGGLAGKLTGALVNGAGTAVLPFASYTDFRTWLLGATATNMAYMLSAQLAAMELNVGVGGDLGKVPASAYLYAASAVGQTACTASGIAVNVNANGFINILDLLASAKAALAVSGGNLTTAAGNLRTCQEYLKTTLDRGNNNQNFVATGPGACALPIYPAAQP